MSSTLIRFVLHNAQVESGKVFFGWEGGTPTVPGECTSNTSVPGSARMGEVMPTQVTSKEA